MRTGCTVLAGNSDNSGGGSFKDAIVDMSMYAMGKRFLIPGFKKVVGSKSGARLAEIIKASKRDCWRDSSYAVGNSYNINLAITTASLFFTRKGPKGSCQGCHEKLMLRAILV